MVTGRFKAAACRQKIGIAADTLANFRGLVCAPIGSKANINGAICLFADKESMLQRQQSELLSTICNQLSVALENARLYVETKKSAAQLRSSTISATNLMTSLEMDELFGYAVFSVGKSLDCDVCGVIVKVPAKPNNGLHPSTRRIK